MKFDFEKELMLEDERALLKPLSINDLENLLPIALSDDKLLQYSPKPIYSGELLLQYIDAALQERSRSNRYPFTIFDRQLKVYAGSTSFLNIDNHNRRIEIGATWLGKDFQQTGLNRHCKFLLLGHAFDTLNFERVEFKTDERNTASRTAIEKLGAQFEGILRSHTLMSDGFRRNTVCYSILKSEWPVIRQKLLN